LIGNELAAGKKRPWEQGKSLRFLEVFLSCDRIHRFASSLILPAAAQPLVGFHAAPGRCHCPPLAVGVFLFHSDKLPEKTFLPGVKLM